MRRVALMSNRGLAHALTKLRRFAESVRLVNSVQPTDLKTPFELAAFSKELQLLNQELSQCGFEPLADDLEIVVGTGLHRRNRARPDDDGRDLPLGDSMGKRIYRWERYSSQSPLLVIGSTVFEDPLDGVAVEFAAVLQIEFDLQLLTIRIDCMHAQVEMFGNCTGRRTLTNERQYF